MHKINFLVLISILFWAQLNARSEKKDGSTITYILKDLTSAKANAAHYSLLKFIQSLYKSDIKDWYDIDGMKSIESDDFMILPVINRNDEISNKPGLYTIAASQGIKVSQRIFDISERISTYYYLMYSIESHNQEKFIIFSGGEHHIRFHTLYSVNNSQKFLSKINELNRFTSLDDDLENGYNLRKNSENEAELLKIFSADPNNDSGLQQISKNDEQYFLIIDKRTNKNYIVRVRSPMDHSWNIFTLDDEMQKIQVTLHDNAKIFFQDKVLKQFINILDDLLGKPNHLNTGTAPYSHTNYFMRLRAKETVKTCALRPWAPSGKAKEFNTIDHIFKRLEEISTHNRLVKQQFAQLKVIIPAARAALQEYYKQNFSYDDKLAEKYVTKNLDRIICSYFSFDR